MSGLRVLVVDDSAVVREALRVVLGREPAIAAIETASDGNVALRKLARFDPDVVTMDVEMPGLDGLATLKRIMSTSPRPVIMLSAFTFQGASKTIRALELGAVDFIQKPGGAGVRDIEAVGQELIGRVLALGKRRRAVRADVAVAPERGAPKPLFSHERGGATADVVIAIGASTGGTEAIRHIVTNLPKTLPASIVVTQHMPEGFTLAFANRLDELAALEIKEATHHDLLRPGRVLIAPGHSHMTVHREHGVAFVGLSRQPPVNGHRPAVDVMFRSVADTFGSDAVGVLLTGMGKDGARGLLELRAAAAATAAESEESCVVFGMPKAAIDLGAAELVLPLGDMPAYILRQAMVRETRRRRTQRPSSD